MDEIPVKSTYQYRGHGRNLQRYCHKDEIMSAEQFWETFSNGVKLIWALLWAPIWLPIWICGVLMRAVAAWWKIVRTFPSDEEIKDAGEI